MENTATKTGKIDLPPHLRGTSRLEHGTKVAILDERPNGNPQKTKILVGDREYTVDKKYVVQT